MPSLKQIRKRIVSVKSTRKITKAMKMVSAAKLRRSTERAEASRPYVRELQTIVQSILQEHQWTSPLLEERKTNKICLVVMSTDRGLCGSLNTNLFKLLSRYIDSNPSVQFEAVTCGKKARMFCQKKGIQIRAQYSDLMREGNYALFEEIAQELREAFLTGDFDKVEIFYNEFKSALVQSPTKTVWLPFALPKAEEGLGTQKSFILEPEGPVLLDRLVPMLIDFQLYRTFLESLASEHGARMTAMDSASNNCRDLIGRLTLQMNRARQAAITKELMEIIGGAEAISAA